jgi:hypothetical protein
MCCAEDDAIEMVSQRRRTWPMEGEEEEEEEEKEEEGIDGESVKVEGRKGSGFLRRQPS